MKEVKIETVLEVYSNLQELPDDIQKLMQAAINARNNAYSPYSNFNVGAAILLDNNETIIGSNQENASYPSGLCAERTAIYYAGAKFSNAKMLKIAISASSQNQLTTQPIPPCGACRQAIAEYEIKQSLPIEIYFMGAEGKVVKSKSLANLLPLVFESSVL
ncbi:cytidine deaminase [Winogradskyella immobilis]|uniref:Cytidine deaminase n=1 Tax=Winogradskyella immobilis TaxID=2816852 RepID=A0ABS8ENN0_9FLAO|nr:cytidine deaminase [Winogradskyella immobilis]MCC1484753.1 cytidine deaminase [Winogradskyella immobilis]MCG0016845.1 cytidine deaminase [Winogradskyella immobilis]